MRSRRRRLRSFAVVAALAAGCSSTSDRAATSSSGPAPSTSSTTAVPASTTTAVVEDVAGSTPTGAAAFVGPLHRVAANGITIGFRRFGAGPPVVLVVGQDSHLGFWGTELPRRLAEHHDVVMFDNRGVGSSTDQPERPLTIELMADDTAALIAALGLDRPTIVGWSTGGEIALALATHHGDAARAIVVSGATAGGPTAVQSSPELTALLSSSSLADQAKLLQYLFTPSGAAARDAYIQGLLAMPSEPVSPQIVQRQADSEAAFVRSTETFDLLGEITTPTVVINGDHDELVPPANATIIAERVEGAELRIVRDAGHALMFQYLDWFVSVVDAASAGRPAPAVP